MGHIKIFDAKLSELPQMMDWVRLIALKQASSPTALGKIELVLEEALVNIIKYAYSEAPGTVEISYTLDSQEHLQFTLKDRGAPFNPLNCPVIPEPSLPIEERCLGGFGLYFIHKFTTALAYERTSNQNILTLTI